MPIQPARRRRPAILRSLLALTCLLAGAGLSNPAPAAAQPPLDEEDPIEVLIPILFNLVEGQIHVVFHTNRDGNYEIYKMQPDGSAPIRLTDNAAFDQMPAFSPGQTQIAFISNRDGDNDIYKMNADGTGVTKLTNNTCNDLTPAWSLNTGQIAWSSNCGGGDYEIWTMNPDGSNPLRRTNNSVDDAKPRWAPQELKLAFTSGTNIAIMNADGSGLTTVTPGSDPDWSPSGQQLAYSCNIGGAFEICLIDVGSGVFGSPVRLTTNATVEFNPVWRPVGLELALLSNAHHGAYEIYTMPAAPDLAFTRITTNTVSEGSPDW